MSSSEDIMHGEKDYGAVYPGPGPTVGMNGNNLIASEVVGYNNNVVGTNNNVVGMNNNVIDHAELSQHHYAQAQIQQGTANPRVRKPYNYGGNPLARVETIDSVRLPAFGGEFQPGLFRDTKERKFANPAPLGLCAFALTTFVLSLINLGTHGVHTPNIVVALAFGYGGLVQLLAGMWEMAVGNTFGATALSSYGGFWISFAIVLTPGGFDIVAAYTAGGNFDISFGFFLFGWFIFTTILLLATLKSTVAFFLLFLTLDLAFLFLALGYIYANAAGPKAVFIHVGGGFGLAAAFLAWYNALAGILDHGNSFFLIPVAHFPWSEKGREMREKKAGIERSGDLDP